MLNSKIAEPNFWDDSKSAQEVVSQMKILKSLVDPFEKAEKQLKDLFELMSLVSDDDAQSLNEFADEIKNLEKEVDSLEFKLLLSDPVDVCDALMSINAGAGGTESCDWVQMLFRLYSRWAERKGFKLEVFDQLNGEEAGIKNITFFIRGTFGYGYLKAEAGVHRLVRISPFDSNKRRHTSFASVDVVADVRDLTEIEIKEADIRIDTYRAGGAGGQHVNKTSSAVRITHIESGVVVQCQNERSQFKNKQSALKVLKARLYEVKRKEDNARTQEKYSEKMEISWGSQIRSYVFQPYSLVKDHRTQSETSDVTRVMDGDIDLFIEAFLKSRMRK